jgi:hypothetical protein
LVSLIGFADQFGCAVCCEGFCACGWARKIQPLTFVKTNCEYAFSSSRLSITAAAV